jgi:membrane protease YdiL (CAAX protease family)
VLEGVAFVAVWVAAGYLLPIGNNGYLLLGIPLTLGFQVLVRRRPIRELFAGTTTRFALGKRGMAMAAVLAVVPGYHAVQTLAGGDWTVLGWYLAAMAGAVGAALPAVAAVAALAKYTALYFPVTFLLEEVAFRGALDAHVHHDGEGPGWPSAILVSALWGLWHLPVASGLPFPMLLVELVVVHVVLGVPLSFAWRRTRNLAGPSLAHAVIDAVRNALMLGL